MNVILDTNILVSGLLNPVGAPGIIINLLLNGKITLFYDSRILFEYENVLSYPKFNLRKDEIISLIEFIKDECIPVIAEPVDLKLKHPDDLKFLEVGLTSKSEYLITGNIKHYPSKVGDLHIVTPAKFINNYI